MYRFNTYSSVLFIIYLIVVVTMEYFSYKFSLENIYFSLPLIAAFIFWSEKKAFLIQRPDSSITKTERYSRDFFLISFSFICGYLLSLLFLYDNSDTIGWWSFGIYVISVFGILFASIFSLFAMMLNNHKMYTLIYSITLILTLLFFGFIMHFDNFSFFAKDETFYSTFLLLLVIHLLLCVGYKFIGRNLD